MNKPSANPPQRPAFVLKPEGRKIVRPLPSSVAAPASKRWLPGGMQGQNLGARPRKKFHPDSTSLPTENSPHVAIPAAP